MYMKGCCVRNALCVMRYTLFCAMDVFLLGLGNNTKFASGNEQRTFRKLDVPEKQPQLYIMASTSDDSAAHIGLRLAVDLRDEEKTMNKERIEWSIVNNDKGQRMHASLCRPTRIR